MRESEVFPQPRAQGTRLRDRAPGTADRAQEQLTGHGHRAQGTGHGNSSQGTGHRGRAQNQGFNFPVSAGCPCQGNSRLASHAASGLTQPLHAPSRHYPSPTAA